MVGKYIELVQKVKQHQMEMFGFTLWKSHTLITPIEAGNSFHDERCEAPAGFGLANQEGSNNYKRINSWSCFIKIDVHFGVKGRIN